MSAKEIFSKYIKEKNISRTDLGVLIGENPQRVSEYALGKRDVPVLKAVKWADFFECSPEDLNKKLAS